jgi:UDP-glucose 4-epimerase
MAVAIDLGAYYRIPVDGRDLNYEKYFEQGEVRITEATEYNSHNTRQLDVTEMKALLLQLDSIQRIVRGERALVEV